MEKKITFTPHGVCSRQIEITLDGDIVKHVAKALRENK